MLQDLNEAQRALAEYMSSLSEEAFSAGWMEGLEYALWSALNGNTQVYGRLIFNTEVLNTLRQLSQEAQGWIYFDEDQEETYISIKDWENKLKEGSIN